MSLLFRSGFYITAVLLCLGLRSSFAFSIDPPRDVAKATSQKQSGGTQTIVRVLSLSAAAGAGYMAYQFHMKSEDVYNEYRASAFTENTDKLREDTKKYDLYRNMAGGISALGVVVFTMSFTF